MLHIQRLHCDAIINDASCKLPKGDYHHVNHRKRLLQSIHDTDDQQSQQNKCTGIFDQTLMKRATHMVYVGIGGSLNGPKAVYEFCRPLLSSKRK